MSEDKKDKEGCREIIGIFYFLFFIQGKLMLITMPPTLVSRPGPSHVFVFKHKHKNVHPHTESQVRVSH